MSYTSLQGSSDDTAANYLKFKCRQPRKGITVRLILQPYDKGNWDVFGSWSGRCPTDSTICGLSVKTESIQGSGDDTALNDVRFYCCRDCCDMKSNGFNKYRKRREILNDINY